MRIACVIAFLALPLAGYAASQRMELDEAEARWSAQKIENYEFTFSTEMHNYIVVRKGRARSVRAAETCCGFRKGAMIPRGKWKVYALSIPDVFDFMRGLLNPAAEGGVIPYDPVFGFPTVVHVDPPEDAHAAATYRVLDFKVLR
jgi:hypothetical protein